MDNFGLGIVLNFTDNASAGMQRASQTFQQMNGLASQLTKAGASSVETLTMLSYSMNALGTQMTQAGKAITGAFTGFGQEMIRVGGILFSARMQMGMLYGSAEQGEAVINRVKEFSKKSIFEFEDLLHSVLRMKSVGIEAFDDITTSSGESTQNLLMYAGDLAAFNPNMRNIYGTGIQAAMGSMIEYIAEGNAMSMKRGAGLDITGILGEDKGETMEERSRQIADLLEKLNMVGAVKGMEGTASQQMSNLSDLVFNLKAAVSDSGVFEKYTELVNRFSQAIFNIPQEDLDKLANTLGDLIVSLMEPLANLIDMATEFITWLVESINENPQMAKTIALFTAAAGVALTLGGVFLKLSSSVMLVGLAFKQIAGINAFGGIFRGIGGSAGFLFTKLLPLVGIATIIYAAWESNFLGIQDIFTNTFSNIGEKMSLIWNGISDKTMTGEEIAKAKELGVLGFIESIVALEYNLSDMFEGFKTGITEVITSLKGLFDIEIDGKTINLFDEIAGFLDTFTGADKSESWNNLGNALGKVFTYGTLALGALKGFQLLNGLIVPALSFVSGHFFLLAGAAAAVWLAVNGKEGIKQAFQSLSDDPAFKTNVGEKVDAVSTSFTTFKTSLTDVWTALKDGKLSEDELEIIKTQLPDAISGIFSSIGELGTVVAPKLGELLVKGFENISANASKYWADISPSLIAFYEGMSSVASAVITPIVDFLSQSLIKAFDWIGSPEGGDYLVKAGADFGKRIGDILFGSIDPATGERAGSWLTELLTYDLEPVLSNILKMIIAMIDNIFGEKLNLYEYFFPEDYTVSPFGNKSQKEFNNGQAVDETTIDPTRLAAAKATFGDAAVSKFLSEGKWSAFKDPEYGTYSTTDPLYNWLFSPAYKVNPQDSRLEPASGRTPFNNLKGLASNEIMLGDMYRSGKLFNEDFKDFSPDNVDKLIKTFNAGVISDNALTPVGAALNQTKKLIAEYDLLEKGSSEAKAKQEAVWQSLEQLKGTEVYSYLTESDPLEYFNNPSQFNPMFGSLSGGFEGVTGKATTADGAVNTLKTSLENLGGPYYVDIILSRITRSPTKDAVYLGEGLGYSEALGSVGRATGGIFSKPTLLRSNTGKANLVGEAGAEAIMPLSSLWGQMDTRIKNAVNGGESVSMSFEAGSVVLQVSGATTDEMQRAAKELMTFIEREQRLRNMARRGVRA